MAMLYSQFLYWYMITIQCVSNTINFFFGPMLYFLATLWLLLMKIHIPIKEVHFNCIIQVLYCLLQCKFPVDSLLYLNLTS